MSKERLQAKHEHKAILRAAQRHRNEQEQKIVAVMQRAAKGAKGEN
jgi:hypothetical protein